MSSINLLKYYENESFVYEVFEVEGETLSAAMATSKWIALWESVVAIGEGTQDSSIYIFTVKDVDGSLNSIHYGDTSENLDLASLYGYDISSRKDELKDQIFSRIPDFVSSKAQSELVYDFNFVREK